MDKYLDTEVIQFAESHTDDCWKNSDSILRLLMLLCLSRDIYFLKGRGLSWLHVWRPALHETAERFSSEAILQSVLSISISGNNCSQLGGSKLKISLQVNSIRGRLYMLMCYILKSLSFFPRQVTWSY